MVILTTALDFVVRGRPVPQGSKRWLPNRRMIEDNPKTTTWRGAIMEAALAAARDAGLTEPLPAPVTVEVTYCFRRPRAHYGTGRNAGTVKASAPLLMHCQKPDGDKLTRALFDALTVARIVVDDSQICECRWVKWWGESDYMAVEVWTAVAP